ncbi:MAG: hypothetical protein NVSMB45_13160 [Ginsengibacter sp.]
MTHKWLINIFFLVFLGLSCSQNTKTPAFTRTEHKSEFFPVTEFFLGELNLLDSLPITPLKITTEKGHIDSQWVKKSEVYHEANEFFDPIIDSAHQAAYFVEKSFLDQTINLYTLSYDPIKNLPTNNHLKRWDVYIDPKTEKVARVYIVKKLEQKEGSLIKHLTWIAGTSFTIITIVESKNQNPIIHEQKVIWKFN